MPTLWLCNRPWHLASDDVPFIALLSAIFHISWSAILGLSLWLIRRPEQCKEGEEYFIFVQGLLVCFILASVVELALAWEGLKGMARFIWICHALLFLPDACDQLLCTHCT